MAATSTTVALVFAGQGSQRPGMAAPWADRPGAARWAEASDILGTDVARLGTDADADELRDPATCQVALFTHGAALLDSWRAAGGAEPVVAAGHSLGEYLALLAVGVINFADGLRLVRARAEATGAAALERPGALVACLGFEVEAVEAAAVATGAHVANDNAPGQVVVAGSSDRLAAFREALAGEKGKIVDVDVGAAYHSPHMEPAVAPFRAALADADLADAAVPVVANVDAAVHTAGEEWRELLAVQLTSPVRWRETVPALAACGATATVELAASSVLTGMIKRADRNLARHAVTAPDELDAAIAATSGG